jgi:hypothetical protein
VATAQTAPGEPTEPERDPRLEWAGPLNIMHRTLAEPLRAVRKEPASAPKQIARIVARGQDAIAPLFDILVEERVPRTHPDDPAQILSDAQRQLLLAALAKFPVERVRAELEQRLALPASETETAQRVAALRVLSVVGNSKDLARLSAIAPRVREEIEPKAAEALRGTYAAILRRDPALLASRKELLKSCDAEAGKQLLFAVGDLGDKRALPLLDDCARTLPALAQQAVSLVPRVGASGNAELDQALAAWLAERLDPAHLEWTRASLRAIGVLDDGSQVPALLDALESPHAGLREAGLDALQRLSSLHLGAAVEAWREWYARETEWRTTGRQAAQQVLASDDSAQVAQALGKYAEHRLFRNELAEDVLAVLEHGSPPMRAMACGTLTRIGSPLALAPLVEHFSDDDDAVAEAAWRAACALTGQALPRSTDEARAQLANS